MEKVISVQNLRKTYVLPKKQGVLVALKGINFNVQKGEIFGILGPNGAGKTTTLEIIEGLKKQNEGRVEVLGLDNLTQTDEIKRRIGVQLQESDYLPHLTLNELLNLFRSLYPTVSLRAVLRSTGGTGVNPEQSFEGSPRSDALPRDDNKKLLQLVGLEDKANETVKNLSGGQKQRFTLATSLVNNPEILFLDEPTTGLDPAARRNLWSLIKQLNASGLTIVLTTHYMEEAEYLCHRVAIMDRGAILKIDEPKKLIDDLAHTTQISFLVEHKLDEKIFQGFPEIEKIYNDFPKIILEIKSLEHIAKIVEVLKQFKINFSGFTVKTASLEDVYLDLTGKEYQE
ncbi:MAG: ABC transporter ATP-binding protein [Patescibacteria group bacterium]